MPRDKTLELTLEKARIDMPLRAGKGKAKRIMIVTLVWPRRLIAERTAVKALDFEGGALDLSKAAWTERILFKEGVSGPFGLRVEVTERVSEPVASEFLRFLGSSILRVGASQIEGAAGTAVGGDLAKLPLVYLSRAVADAKAREPEAVASGVMDLDTAGTWKSRKTVSLKVPVKALKPVYSPVEDKRATRPKKRRLLLKQGDACGEVVMKGKVY